MLLSLIFALDERNGIGKNNTLPWHLPADLKKFKQLTMGHHMLMGRKTWESIGKALPGRTSVVITRNAEIDVPGVVVKRSLEDALDFAKLQGETEAFVIGGAQLFNDAIPLADRFYLTRIHHTFDADTFLPPINMDEWKVIEEQYFPADEKNAYDFTLYILERRK
ncbi:MAG: dihydrofolate reductase [Bacteroidia bacterium]